MRCACHNSIAIARQSDITHDMEVMPAGTLEPPRLIPTERLAAMKHVTACMVLFLALSIGAPVKAAAPEKFEKECVKSLPKSERKRLHGEHEAYCRCVTEAGQRLGFTRKEFAIERERMSRDPEAVASGRMRQISNMCRDGMNQTARQRSGF